MWYRMKKIQQKILGIAGVLLFGFLMIIILMESEF
jgi:hypothetical protein